MSIPNSDNMAELFPILKLLKYQSHQTQLLLTLDHITFLGDGNLNLEITWNGIGTSFSNAFGTFCSLPKYRDLHHADKNTLYDFILPQKKSQHFPQAQSTYFQLADALHTYLHKSKTISISQALKAHMIFSLKRHNPC
eukprot:4739262-Ditylum_brightwellii.AAC.2